MALATAPAFLMGVPSRLAALALLVLTAPAAALSAEPGHGSRPSVLMRSESVLEYARVADGLLVAGPTKVPVSDYTEPMVRSGLLKTSAGAWHGHALEDIARIPGGGMEEPSGAAPPPTAVPPPDERPPPPLGSPLPAGAVSAGGAAPVATATSRRSPNGQVPDEGDYHHHHPSFAPKVPVFPTKDQMKPQEPEVESPDAPVEEPSVGWPHRRKWTPVDIAGSQPDDDLPPPGLAPKVKVAASMETPLTQDSPEEELLRASDGVGSLTYERSPTSSRLMNHDFRRRLEVQDVATVLLLLAVFAFTLLLSSSIIYKLAEDPSPVTFYTDPKYTPTAVHSRLTCGSLDSEAWLRTFNTQPQCARLRIIGKSRGYAEWHVLLRQCRFREFLSQSYQRISAAMARRPRRRDPRLPSWDAVMFDVSLDLTPFVTSDGRLASDADAIALEKHLHSANPLEVLLLRKEVEWPCWEDIATNIKQRLRGMGFPGDVEVRLEAKEEVLVYRNEPWQNFVRSRLTQVLVIISVIGWLFWAPYLRMRMRTVQVESRFRISLDLARYWEHLSEGLHATEGFLMGPMTR